MRGLPAVTLWAGGGEQTTESLRQRPAKTLSYTAFEHILPTHTAQARSHT